MVPQLVPIICTKPRNVAVKALQKQASKLLSSIPDGSQKQFSWGQPQSVFTAIFPSLKRELEQVVRASLRNPSLSTPGTQCRTTVQLPNAVACLHWLASGLCFVMLVQLMAMWYYQSEVLLSSQSVEQSPCYLMTAWQNNRFHLGWGRGLFFFFTQTGDIVIIVFKAAMKMSICQLNCMMWCTLNPLLLQILFIRLEIPNLLTYIPDCQINQPGGTTVGINKAGSLSHP